MAEEALVRRHCDLGALDLTGTGLAASITVFGNSVVLTKAWFIVGAVLTGYPLAQGSLYLLMPRNLADRMTVITLPLSACTSRPCSTSALP